MIDAAPASSARSRGARTNPSLGTLKWIADTLGIPIGLLFEDEPKAAPSPVMKKNSHWDIITEGTVHYTLLSPGVVLRRTHLCPRCASGRQHLLR